ncbi:hypothetical protein BT96DRAFT_1026966 [Gymnopus androsaceus JB14]|uniref:Uncharacterized protein n=1 Tax=Gymnopus androsaceus JB14 TaxID=1447944 RepID=A0A6A4GFT4_9AGAR|nr:hypothetical protein BT96DRAFT_1026966 [Gymnopus androsaceus JB14]
MIQWILQIQIFYRAMPHTSDIDNGPPDLTDQLLKLLPKLDSCCIPPEKVLRCLVRNRLSSLSFSVYSFQFEELALHLQSSTRILRYTAQRELISALSYNLGGTQGILDELRIALPPSLRELLSFNQGLELSLARDLAHFFEAVSVMRILTLTLKAAGRHGRTHIWTLHRPISAPPAHNESDDSESQASERGSSSFLVHPLTTAFHLLQRAWGFAE